MTHGVLYIVGTPIGNPADISYRAVETLAAVDIVACEERKDGLRLLARHGITKPVIEVNEHTESDAAPEVVLELLSGKSVALISDCGMPVFAVPGTVRVRLAVQRGIRITTLPGPASLTAALALSGMDVTRFYFYGFLSPKRPERIRELAQLRLFPSPVVFLDAPYRLNQVLEDMTSAFGRKRHACVACDLTLPEEEIRRGTLGELRKYFEEHARKREFVIIVDAEKKRESAQGKTRKPR